MTLYYQKSLVPAEVASTKPSGTDVGYQFLQYYTRSTVENPPRVRGAMITNNDSTYDFVFGIYSEDHTYSEVDFQEGVLGANWAADFAKFAGVSLVSTMTRAEFNALVTEMTE